MASILLISLSACASAPGGPDVAGGVASYDALKSASAACAARGGELVRSDEGSGKRMTDYACKRK
ncbi:hypothetical protein [Phenylobacterium sp.]|uniref:hypothetical protein n=1 Tax=Phenylobacterium sp. TaxID=1871053 RepID=UPI0028A0AA26|nr:hypothetical protein [Phenylobacterium sp.]